MQSIYDQFTEGFDTADLRDAKALMRSLRQNIRPKTEGVDREIRITGWRTDSGIIMVSA